MRRAADPACAAKFLAAVGRLLYRRPLPEALLKEAVDKAGETADRLKDFYAGLHRARRHADQPARPVGGGYCGARSGASGT